MSIEITYAETNDCWGDEPRQAEANRAPENLDEMLTVLRANANWPGAPMAGGELDWTSLPVFGGPEPDNTIEVWSWDAQRLLVGTHQGDLEIVERTEWG